MLKFLTKAIWKGCISLILQREVQKPRDGDSRLLKSGEIAISPIRIGF